MPVARHFTLVSGFYLGFKMGGREGGAIIDNIAVGVGTGGGCSPLPREAQKLRHFMI